MTGRHNLKVILPEKTYEVNFNINTSKLLIKDIVPCPSPYDAKTGSCTFTINSSKNGTVVVYLYDSQGILVWKNEFDVITGFNKNITWDGKDLMGESLANGVYSIIAVAKDSPEAPKSRNKIILLR